MSKDISEKDRSLLVADLDISLVEDPQVLSEPVAREVVNSDPTVKTGKQRFLDYIERYKALVAKANVIIAQVDSLSSGLAFSPATAQEKQLREAIRRVFKKNTSTITYDMYKAALTMRDELSVVDTRKNTGRSVFLNEQEK